MFQSNLNFEFLHGAFQRRAKEFPDQVALIYDDSDVSEMMTYREIAHSVDQVSSLLRQQECSDGVVGLSCDINIYIPSILIGILDTPAAFWYLSPAGMRKPELMRPLLQHVNFLILDSKLLKEAWIVEHFDICNSSEPLKRFDAVLLKRKSPVTLADDLRHVAYVITTSGSTGEPKVVCVPHRCILPNITDLARRFCVTASDRLYLASPLTFDPGVVDVFLALSSGASLLLTPDSVRLHPATLKHVLNTRGVTILQATPTFLRRFHADDLRHSLLSDVTRLRLLSVGGEACPGWAELWKWGRGSGTEVWNLYGVTEMSCWATAHRITESDEEEVPLGEPLSDTRLVVRDQAGREVHEGEGMLYLASATRRCTILEGGAMTTPTEVCTGDLVTVKYSDVTMRINDVTVANDAETDVDMNNTVTGTSFHDDVTINHDVIFPNDASNHVDVTSRSDVTANVTRRRCVYYRGRVDDQVKRLGKRIDLSGLERVVRSQPYVDDVTMVLHADQLLAFVQSASPLPDLKYTVNRRLPEHASIDDVINVTKMPMTSHGKVDRWKLLSLRPEPPPVVPYDDVIMDRMWADHFRLSKPDDSQTFLQLGGDSIGAVNFALKIGTTFGSGTPNLVDLLLSGKYCDIKTALSNHYSKTNGQLDKTTQSFVSETLTESHEDHQKTDHKSRKRKASSDAGERLAVEAPVMSILSRCNGRTLHSAGAGMMEAAGMMEGDTVDVGDGEVGLRLLWSYDTGKCVDASPLVVTDGESSCVYIGSHSHQFVCLTDDGSPGDAGRPGDAGSPGVSRAGSAASAGVVWRAELGGRVESSACLSACGRYVVVGCYDYRVYVLCRDTGGIAWSHVTGAEVKSSPCLDDVTRYVIVGSHDHHLHALDVESRRLAWRVDVDGSSIFSSPCVSSSPHHVYTATLAGTIAALQPTTGRVMWRRSLGKPVFSSPACGGSLVAVGCVDQVIYTFSHHGQQLHSVKTDAPVFSSPTFLPTMTDDMTSQVVCGSHDHHVYCIRNSELKWRIKLDEVVYSSPFIGQLSTNERAVFVASTKSVYVLDQSGSVLHRESLPGEIFSSPVVYRNRLFIGCRDNTIYCYEIR